MAKRLLLWNSGSGKSRAAEQWRQGIENAEHVEVVRDLNLNEVVEAAVTDGCEVVIAAGGDGTINAVVNALMRVDQTLRPKLAVLPLGTANDFAGTLGIPDDLEAALGLVDKGHCRPRDVVKISAPNYERYYANMAAGGNCVRVSEELTDEMKEEWGAFCYMRGAVSILADMTNFRILADCDNERFELDSWAVLVANGKTNAGRLVVAPQASTTDGLMDVIIIREGNVLDMVEMVSKTLLSSFLDCDQVIFRQVRQLKLHSVPGMRFTIDGEVIDEEPIQFDVVPGAIRIFGSAEAT